MRLLFVTNEITNSLLNADTGIVDNNLVVCYTKFTAPSLLKRSSPGKARNLLLYSMDNWSSMALPATAW